VAEPSSSEPTTLWTDDSGTLIDLLAAAEKQIIQRVLKRYEGNRQETAQKLGISRTSLFRKMRDLDLQ
jgi:DNA-binding NtrC family response regulator